MKLIKYFLRSFFFLFIKINFFSSVTSWIIFIIIYFKNRNFNPQKKINIFALSSYRFRGDLEVLQKTNEINIIKFPLGIQYFLFSKYSNEMLNKSFFLKKKNEPNYLYQNELNEIFDKLLSLTLNKFKINMSISASLIYLQDSIYFDFLKMKKIKIIINTREYVGIESKQTIYFEDYLKKLNLFTPDLISCQNEITKKIYEKKINSRSCKILSLGSLRMDEFLVKIKNNKNNSETKKKKNIVFFSFFRNIGLHFLNDGSTLGSNDLAGLNNFFKNVHQILIEFAKDNPDYNLIIKPKMGGHFIDEIKNTWFQKFAKPLPKNCKITTNDNAQDLILDADLVIAFNSSTVLESGLREIPVLIPAFDETVNEYREYFEFSEYERGFEVIKNKETFPDLIKIRLNENSISKEQMKIRYELFEKYLSRVDGNVTSNYVKELKKLL